MYKIHYLVFGYNYQIYRYQIEHLYDELLGNKQISTDHFYQDDGPKAHKEKDQTFFLNEYAKSKLTAENEITKRGRNFLILRTSILGLSKEQRSYLDLILENIPMQAVADQVILEK